MTTPAKGPVRVQCHGPGCDVAFQAKSSRAKYCSSACSRRAQRSRSTSGSRSGGELVKAVRADLESAGKLESYVGQAAVTIAGKLEAAQPGQAAGLARELDRLMGLAIGVKPPAPEQGDEDESLVEEPDDEISAARRRAHAKMQRMAAGE